MAEKRDPGTTNQFLNQGVHLQTADLALITLSREELIKEDLAMQSPRETESQGPSYTSGMKLNSPRGCSSIHTTDTSTQFTRHCPGCTDDPQDQTSELCHRCLQKPDAFSTHSPAHKLCIPLRHCSAPKQCLTYPQNPSHMPAP